MNTDKDQPNTGSAPPEEPSRNFKFGETPAGVALICILAAMDCIMARLRVEDSELQEAVKRKFEQAGCAMPPELIVTDDGVVGD